MIVGRPEISKELGSKRFREYYYLETELIGFCKKNGLDFSGDKNDLTERICAFLDGKKPEPKFIIKQEQETKKEEITEDMLIEDNFELTDKHYEFFKSVIGSYFYVNDAFEEWLATHTGHTYSDAVDAWYTLEEE